MQQSVSVIIPAYNYGRFIADAICSVLEQTRPASEIVVVDDGSTDDTGAVVAAFGNQVKYVRQENSGVCAARNHGVGESTGELIALLDADDIWEPTNLEKQIARFEADPSLGLVHCGMREFDDDTGMTIDVYLEGAEEEAARNLLLWERPAVNVSGSAVTVRRNAFDAVGGFDTRMKVGEDWDFCYRVACRFKVGFVPEPLVNYRSHRSAAHRDVREMERGMSLFYEKAFANGDAEVLKLKRRALGNFHRVLAGSYFQSHDYAQFLSHAARSILNRPAAFAYFLEFPIRRLKRKKH